MQPLNDQVCVRMKPRSVPTLGVIVGVEDISDRVPSNEGVVVAVGPGRVNKRGVHVPMDVQVGDRVMVASPGPSAPVAGVCIDERERLWMITEADIVGVLEADEEAHEQKAA